MFRDEALIESYFLPSRDMQKHLFDFCMPQIDTVLAGEIQISFSNYKISFCSKSSHRNTCNEPIVFVSGEERL